MSVSAGYFRGAVAISLFYVSSPSFRQEVPSVRVGNTLMLASYLGAASFCISYGVNYTDLADRLSDAFKSDENLTDDEVTAFQEGRLKGELGLLYSPEAGRYINLPLETADVSQACSIAHQQVIKLSKLK
ncbi:hypothetical protein [uncultured Marivita sp.]|uniref:hypothetical protein n=1 Tax=uncultured Marivita sp. TaxID=888080 RepID=UPI0025DC14E5|nr:hypothetical protein [uncultured Marivita sp.]MCR9111382.1 hypothetical protein [Paracoccaceae bacterium]